MSEKNPLLTTTKASVSIQLPPQAQMKDYQDYINRLEKYHGWDQVDLVHNCFLMGEEVGELFKGVRKYLKYAQEETGAHTSMQQEQSSKAENIRTSTSAGMSLSYPNTTASNQELSNIVVSEQSKQEQSKQDQSKENIAEEIIDVFNYLLAIANRLDIDVEKAFIEKNHKNQKRTWQS